MRVVFGLVLVAGVALAGGAVYMAKNHIGAYQTALAKERAAAQRIVPTVDVWVAERPLAYGEPLMQEDVRQVAWPENAIPEGTYLVAEGALFPEGEEALRTVIRPMEKDEAIMAVKVTEPGKAAGITTRLERGMRAFAIKVDVASGVSGFLRPGDRVDVYWTGRVDTGERNRGDLTKLIEAGIQLIAIDQSAAGDVSEGTIAQTVTVQVKPSQVAALAQAQSTGRLSLSLVGANDDTIAGAIEIDQDQLLGIQRQEAKAPEAPKEEQVCTIRTRRGAEVVEIPIPCTN
ncbi:MAG: Flp pilus assembly protein CpaB [Pseudomonadota bacterium]